MRFIAGTYTKLGGEGVVLCALEGQTLRRIAANSAAYDPTYVIPTPDGTGFVAGGKENGNGYVERFALRGDTITSLERAFIGRNGCCHMAFSRAGDALFTANYTSGSVSVLPVENGVLRDAVQVIDHAQLSGAQAHAHCVCLDPTDPHTLIAVDLGCDSLFFYRVKGACLTRTARVKLEEGSGPRHLVWGRDGDTIYVAHELSNHVSVLKRTGNGFVCVQYIATLPENGVRESYCGAIRLSSDGKTLYVTNRGHDSVARFCVLADGTLSFEMTVPAHGLFPRDLWVLEDGRLLCANQNGGGITLVSPEGTLLARLEMTGAVCVCPIK